MGGGLQETPEHVSLIFVVHRLCTSALCLRLISVGTARSLNINQVVMKWIDKQTAADQPLPRPFSTLTVLIAARRKLTAGCKAGERKEGRSGCGLATSVCATPRFCLQNVGTNLDYVAETCLVHQYMKVCLFIRWPLCIQTS